MIHVLLYTCPRPHTRWCIAMPLSSFASHLFVWLGAPHCSQLADSNPSCSPTSRYFNTLKSQLYLMGYLLLAATSMWVRVMHTAIPCGMMQILRTEETFRAGTITAKGTWSSQALGNTRSTSMFLHWASWAVRNRQLQDCLRRPPVSRAPVTPHGSAKGGVTRWSTQPPPPRNDLCILDTWPFSSDLRVVLGRTIHCL